MAYPCFICGDEVGPECMCEDCAKDLDKGFPVVIVNGQWCPKHQIIHWREEPCPMCVKEPLAY